MTVKELQDLLAPINPDVNLSILHEKIVIHSEPRLYIDEGGYKYRDEPVERVLEVNKK